MGTTAPEGTVCLASVSVLKQRAGDSIAAGKGVSSKTASRLGVSRLRLCAPQSLSSWALNLGRRRNLMGGGVCRYGAFLK